MKECDGVCNNGTNSETGKTIRKCMELGDNELGCTTVDLPFGDTSVGIDLFHNVSIWKMQNQESIYRQFFLGFTIWIPDF